MVNASETQPTLCPSSNVTNASTSACFNVSDVQGNGPGTNTTTFSLPYPLPVFDYPAKVRVIVTFVLCFASLVGNLLVFITMFRNRARKSRVNLLIMHLAVADIFMTLIVMPLDGVWNLTVQWYAGDVACRILQFLKLWALYASTFILVVISIDRCMAILRPLSSANGYKRGKIMVGIAWGAGAVLSTPQAVIWHLIHVHPTPMVTFIQCSTHGFYTADWQEQLYNACVFFLVFIFPLTIMITCYLLILVKITRKYRELTDPTANQDNILRHSGSARLAKAKDRTWLMTFVIVSAFVINWSPYYVISIWYLVDKSMVHYISKSASHTLFIFGLTNPCLDPLIYGLFSINFSREFRRCCGFLKRRDLANESPYTMLTVVGAHGDTAGTRMTPSVSASAQFISTPT
ncbi:gonadotropin-releasing hormone receptor-like [Branchiostoma floridae]|uniref:Type II GnRH receptor n=1 Tax=Branchiostoma floridae TaxID=7739 RepID=A9XCC9_BRAFL|nr:gonadotropin-releasing hormone receptor-like [Branchiostoma floridae]ABO77113.1 gonadotropin-releasing hormone receptor 1a [Branchiostoma floridae]BAH03911.1 GnRH receptor A [Branchiostoma floridae]BAH03912.1 GnRH receptor A [Branchiostoma floridae]